MSNGNCTWVNSLGKAFSELSKQGTFFNVHSMRVLSQYFDAEVIPNKSIPPPKIQEG